jgi:hypothetical protein
MTSPITVDAVTAVRLGDGWHTGITGFYFYGDGQCPLVTQAGAIWWENGCRFSCPLPAILAIREGAPPAAEASLAKTRSDTELQKAIKWLSEALQDNEPKDIKVLIKDAKAAAGISEGILRKAKEELHVGQFKEGKFWFWVLAQSYETEEFSTGSSSLIDFERAE